jgi:hypothetical protein
MFLLFHYCSSSIGTLVMFLLFLVHPQTITIPLDLFVHPKQLLLFFVILLFILSNCFCSSWSSYSSSTVIALLPNVFVHPQQILFMILFFIFSTTPTTLCPLVFISLSIGPPPPHSSNFYYVSKVVIRMLWFLSSLTFEPWFIVGPVSTSLLLNQGLHPCIQ